MSLDVELARDFDAQVGCEVARDTRLRLDVFNLFNAKTSDITCFYTSRLPGEPAGGVDGTHFHPWEKRSFRVTASCRSWHSSSGGHHAA